MQEDQLARRLIGLLRLGDEAAAYNVAAEIAAGERDAAVLTLLQLAAMVAHQDEVRG